jgi:hypothetical protein
VTGIACLATFHSWQTAGTLRASVTSTDASAKPVAEPSGLHEGASQSHQCFVTAEQARRGELNLSRVDADSRDALRRQAMAPTWKLDADGCRVVEPKVKFKERVGRSPDGMDAMNLAYYHSGTAGPALSVTMTRTNPVAGAMADGLPGMVDRMSIPLPPIWWEGPPNPYFCGVWSENRTLFERVFGGSAMAQSVNVGDLSGRCLGRFAGPAGDPPADRRVGRGVEVGYRVGRDL